MAIIKQRGLQLTVDTIGDRNAIVKRPDHLVVHVKDAIADVTAGAGTAIYRWSEHDSTWVLISAGAEKTITFETNEQTIINGEVTLPNIPLNHNVWEIMIVDRDITVAYPRVEDLSFSNGTVSGLDAWGGLKLRCTYAYGTITDQLKTALDSKSSIYETPIDPLTVTNNHVKAGDFWHDTFDPGRIAIALTLGGALVWMEI